VLWRFESTSVKANFIGYLRLPIFPYGMEDPFLYKNIQKRQIGPYNLPDAMIRKRQGPKSQDKISSTEKRGK
jgi:hypothetical protein